MKNILMNVEMTIAIQDDRKTNTRRCIKNTKYADFSSMKIDENVYPKGRLIHYKYMGKNCSMFSDDFIKQYAKYQIGETIEVFKQVDCIGDCNVGIPCQSCGSSQGIGVIEQSANILLKITNVRVERLQDISDDTDNFMSEGFSHDTYEIGETLKNKMYSNDTHGECDFEDDCMHDWWINLWNKTAPKGYKWEDNPYVFVYEFERAENV